ncbi:Acetoin utilization deacetylase AcuC [Planctomycetales bacterium 10988]|nr:Acetoin utilization deacetylase AcuC [Planctomycetales bacterium 10988]
MLLYTHPDYLEHKTGQHPEQPNRLRAISQQLQEEGLIEKCRQVKWQPVENARIERVHTPELLQEIEQITASGGGMIDADTVISPHSLQAAKLASGAVCDAIDRVLSGETKRAFCLHRPPGHHATFDQAMGFCLINHVAVAARYALDEKQLDRILIIDWDVHHGNGTQDLFYRDPQVGFFSIHRYPFYPGTGSKDETGEGPGLGTTLNKPLPFGISREEFFDAFQSGLEEITRTTKPQLILLSAGFDAHRLDPVGSLGLETEDFGRLTQIVDDVAQSTTKGKIVSLLEGGYHLEMLAESVALHLRTLLDREEKESA